MQESSEWEKREEERERLMIVRGDTRAETASAGLGLGKNNHIFLKGGGTSLITLLTVIK